MARVNRTARLGVAFAQRIDSLLATAREALLIALKGVGNLELFDAASRDSRPGRS